jgi:chromosome segregation ATPase
MASQGPHTNDVGRKASKSIRALETIIDAKKFNQTALEGLMTTLTFAEARTSRLLEDKEDLILELQTKAFETDGLVDAQKRELLELKDELGNLEKANARFENMCLELEKSSSSFKVKAYETWGIMRNTQLQNEELKAELADLANAKKQHEETKDYCKGLMDDKEELKTEAERLAEEKRSLAQRESSLMDVISSLRNDKLKLEKQLAANGAGSDISSGGASNKKRKLGNILNISSQSNGSDDERPKQIKSEPIERPLRNVKHWAPEGYYYVKEVGHSLFKKF